MKNKRERELLQEIKRLQDQSDYFEKWYMMYRKSALELRTELARLRGEYGFEDKHDTEGKYGTYEELSKLYEDSHANYLALSEILNTTVGKLAYQNMMLEKAREAYKYITAEDRDKLQTNK